MAVEKLMANGFRSHYTSSHFRQKYNEYRSKLKVSFLFINWLGPSDFIFTKRKFYFFC